MKNFIVGSGWKMVKTYKDSILTAMDLKRNMEGFHDFPVVIFPSFPAIPEIARRVGEDSAVKIGGQDMFWEEGAYTGEISGRMLLEIGCRYVEINHQERRRFLREDDEMANRKLMAALKLGLHPFLCVGEEEKGSKEEVRAFISRQMNVLLRGVTANQVGSIIFAYEPMWAIGQKASANSEHIQCVHELIRQVIKELYDISVAQKTLIVYGGGIRMDTYLDIAMLPDVNGLFTTGCGIYADTYSELVLNTAARLKRGEK